MAAARQVIMVPESAIEFDGGETYVNILKGNDGQQQTFERRKVTTGLSDGLNIEIKSGLSSKEKVRGQKVVETEEE